MSEETPKPEDQPAEPTGILQSLSIPNGATVAEIEQLFIAKLRRDIADTEKLHNDIEKIVESGVNIGFLYKDGARYFLCSPGSQSPHREQKRVRSKKQKREGDAERSSNRSDDIGGWVRRRPRQAAEWYFYEYSGNTRKRQHANSISSVSSSSSSLAEQ